MCDVTPRRERRRRRHLATALAVGLAIGLWSSLASAQEIDPLVLGDLLDFNKVVTALIILAAAIVGTRVGTAALDGLGERLTERRLLLKKVASLGRFLIYFGSVMIIIFGVIQPERESLFAIFGTLAVAVGLALKDLIGSIIAGVIVLLDSPFQVGDRVQYGSTYGEVVEIGLRAVKINTLDDNLVSIPNNKFLTDVVASANAGALDMMVEIDFYIGVEEDHELAKKLVREATVTSRFVYLVKPVIVHVLDLPMGTAYSTRLKSKLYISDTRFETAVKTDITERVKRSFRQHRIRAPYHYERSVQVKLAES